MRSFATWDPGTYLQFADERGRPFFDLVARVPAVEPEMVVDLGCGAGQLTATLAERWPTAQVWGVDLSEEMLDFARRLAHDRLRFSRGDVRDWQPDEAVDVLISNATLQWVPRHRELLPGWVAALSVGGWLAIQVPGNFDEPSHRLLLGLAADSRFAAYVSGTPAPEASDATTYLADLAALGCTVEAWETTYLHVLHGPDPVFRWMLGTGARPILQALPEELRPDFERDYRRLLHEAYPERSFGTVLPYRRVFVIAQRRG